MHDLGLEFKFKGGDRARSDTERLGSSWTKLSNAMDRRIHSMSVGMKNFVSRVGVQALALGTIFGGVGAAVGLLTSRSRIDLTNEQANLRALGLDDAAIERAEKAASNYSRRVAGVTATDYTKALYDTVSAFSDLSGREQLLVNDIALMTGKATKMSAAESTKLFGSFWGAAGDTARKQGAQAFTERWGSIIYETVRMFKTTGPELAAAAKNSLSLLYEAGWKPEQMAAWWGKMINAGLSGEEAGTAMKQFATKEREGFGKLMLQSSRYWLDEKAMHGKAKATAKRRNEILEEEYGKWGAEMFLKNPVKWLDTLGGAVERLKTQGKDYKKLLAEAFGEREVGALLTLIRSRSDLGSVEKSIASKTFGDVRSIVEQEMAKGIGPATDLLSQIWGGLVKKTGKIFEPTTIRFYKWLSGNLAGVSDFLEGKLPQLQAGMGAFADGLASTFSGAAKHLAEQWPMLERVKALLEAPDPDGWRKLGEEFGGIASVNFSETIAGLKAMGHFLEGIAKILAYVGSGYKALSEAMPFMHQDAGSVKKWLGNTLGNKEWWWGKNSQDVISKKQAEENNPLNWAWDWFNRNEGYFLRGGPKPAPEPIPRMPDRLLPGAAAREQMLQQQGAAPSIEVRPEVHVNIDGNVELDGQKLGRIVGRMIGEQVKADAARSRDSYGMNPRGFALR